MPIGGAEKVLIDILNNFDYAHYKVSLLLYHKEGDFLSRVSPNVEIIKIYGKSKRTLCSRVVNKIIEITSMRAILERFITRRVIDKTYDCIISFCQGPAHKLHTYILDKASKNITWVHTDLSKENWGILFFDKNLKKQEAAYNLMDQIIFVSEGVKTTFNSVFDLSDKVKQTVLYNVIDVQSVIKQSEAFSVVKPDKFIFVNSGRLVDQKKQVKLIEAARYL